MPSSPGGFACHLALWNCRWGWSWGSCKADLRPWLLPLFFFFLIAQSDASPVLRLFGSIPDTGSYAVGLPIRWGANRAVQDVAEAGLGFRVEITWRDDECSRQSAIEHLIDEAMTWGTEPYHAILGSGCSAACIGLAELSSIWSMPIMSWGCASPSLSDSATYPYFTRTDQSGVIYSRGHVMMMRYMNWKSLGCVIYREESLYFVNLQNSLVSYLEEYDLGVDLVGTYYYESASSVDDLRNLATELTDRGTRIVVLGGYEANVARSFCGFHLEGLTGSHWVFMTFAWFSSQWLTTSAEASGECPSSALLSAAVGMIGTTSGTWTPDESMRTLVGDIPQDLKEEYYNYMEANSTLAGDDSAALIYDSVWALALAMQSHLATYPTALVDTPDRNFLTNFTATIIEQDFFGATGRVHYSANGDRIGYVEIRQMDDTQTMILKASCNTTSCVFIDTLDFGLSEPWNPAEPAVLDGRVPSSAALSCGDDLILEPAANICEPCPSGKVLLLVDNVKSCVCAAGSNTSASDSSTCSLCPAGRYASTVGVAGACKSCAAGSYTDKEGSTGCDRCPVGSWQDKEGSSSCNTCPDSMSTQVLGADTSELCLCPLGTISISGGSSSTSTTCVTCGEGMDCTSWNTSELMSLPGYMLWNAGTGAAPGLPGVFQCSVGKHRCPGGPMGTCASGRQGLLCSECLPGLVGQSDGSCGACSTANNFLAVTFMVFTFLALLAIYLWSTRGQTLGGEFTFFVVTFLSVMLTFCQTLAVLDMLAVEWGSPLNDILSVMSIFVFDVDVTNLSCVASMSEVTAYSLWATVLPLMTLVLMIFAGLHSLVASKMQVRPWQTAAGSLNSLGFISYSALILSIFQCEGHPSGVLTVRSRSSVVCWTSSEHRSLLVAGSIFLLWPIAFLSSCALAVHKLPQKISEGNKEFLRTWEFLFGRFRTGCHWFSLVVFSRGLLLSLISVLTNAALQIIVMQFVLLAVFGMTCSQRPWRTRIMDFFDRALISPTLIMTLVVAPFFVDADNIEFVPWLPFVALLCCIISAGVLSIAQLGLFIKRRNQKPYHFFLCHHKVGAGSFARLLKMRLKSTRRIVGDVWLDSDNLTDMSLLLTYVQQAQICVALCSEQLLMRPWCVGELTTAYLSKTETVLIKFPNCSLAKIDGIDNFEAIVPDVNKLLAHGIDMPSIRAMLLWLPDNREISLELPLAHGSVANLAWKLLNLHDRPSASHNRSERDSSTGYFSGGGVHAKRAIIADPSSIEALANAWIVATLLSTSYATEPEKVPEVLLAGATLETETDKVVIICSENCFENADVINNLVVGSSIGMQSLPIITQEEFRFPSEAFFQELLQKGIGDFRDHKTTTIVPIIRSIFQEIAIVLKPADYSTTEAILAVRAKEIAQRLDGTLSVLDPNHCWTSGASTYVPTSNGPYQQEEKMVTAAAPATSPAPEQFADTFCIDVSSPDDAYIGRGFRFSSNI